MRFKLKTEYTQFVRDQIRGGLWFAPSWWNALSKVPPTHFQPHVQRKLVPKISFLEDKLKSDFHMRNPVIAAFDKGKPGVPNSTLAASFAERQIQAITEEGKTQKEAYDVAMSWMFENANSQRLLRTLQVPPNAAAMLAMRPEDVVKARDVAEKALAAQADVVRAMLDDSVSGANRSGNAYGTYRSFASPIQNTIVQQRMFGNDPALDFESVDEADAARVRASAESSGRSREEGAQASVAAASPGVLDTGMEEEVAKRVLEGGAGGSGSSSSSRAPSGAEQGRQSKGGKQSAGKEASVRETSPKGQDSSG